LVIVREVTSKSIVNKCGLSGIDYSINPYVGCQHGCSYCYARFLVNIQRRNEQWGEFVDVKINAPQLVAKQLPKLQPGIIWISSVTDPYQPLESKYRVTLQLLQKLLPYRFPISILTKSKLIVRDIDVFRQFDDIEIGMTLISLDDTVRQRFEPFTSSIDERLDALKLLHESQVRTYAFIGPFLPHLSEATIEALIIRLEEAGVNRVLIDRLNVRSSSWSSIKRILQKYYPDLIQEFTNALSFRSEYYQKVKREISSVMEKRNLSFSFCY
jgi:DNA repair photolyase